MMSWNKNDPQKEFIHFAISPRGTHAQSLCFDLVCFLIQCEFCILGHPAAVTGVDTVQLWSRDRPGPAGMVTFTHYHIQKEPQS